MRSLVGVWRWRSNPLCRRTDRREAWLALWVAVLIAVCAPLAGWLGAQAAHGSLHRAAVRQQQERHPVWAVAKDYVNRPPSDTDPESAADPQNRRLVLAQWTGPEGHRHTRAVDAVRGVQPGERFKLWTDDKGRLTARPMSEQAAASHAALAGLAAAAGAAGLLEAGRRITMHQLMRRRFARWEAEWQRNGPDWGRTLL
ncbi:hypothetical protein [Streptomyces sp. ODS28]|uniref:Rv1733c family protein n=1 Tax=Streptomyces sp. ODS28 TaxID=3136688 RepID=UPI0031E942C3